MTCRLNVSVEWKSLLPLWWRVSFCFGRHLGSGHSVSHFILSAWSVSNASLIWERASGRKNVLRKLLCIRRAGFSVCWLYLFVSFWESSDWDWMKYTRCEHLLLIKPFLCYFYSLENYMDSQQPMLKEKQIIPSVWGRIKSFEHFQTVRVKDRMSLRKACGLACGMT